MTMRDHLGLAMSGADPDSLAGYQSALAHFQCYVGDPLAELDDALAQRLSAWRSKQTDAIAERPEGAA